MQINTCYSTQATFGQHQNFTGLIFALLN